MLKVYVKSLKFLSNPQDELGGSIYMANGSKDAQLFYEDDLRRTMFSSTDRVTAEIQERFQQLQNVAQKYAFLRSEVILSTDELNKLLKTLIKKNFNLIVYVYKLS
ncbi:uncharacterized protein TNCV_4809911 [Trichonephila clavipes]|uniref:Uncharacterized protein n=1 Tax=Trichonephila clavipes TaxID=2585209 RepID=A0A8X6V4J2_TRICX|nr:uncharacterized protein TNCV_4809911 [Trichonephila clavipes]